MLQRLSQPHAESDEVDEATRLARSDVADCETVIAEESDKSLERREEMDVLTLSERARREACSEDARVDVPKMDWARDALVYEREVATPATDCASEALLGTVLAACMLMDVAVAARSDAVVEEKEDDRPWVWELRDAVSCDEVALSDCIMLFPRDETEEERDTCA